MLCDIVLISVVVTDSAVGGSCYYSEDTCLLAMRLASYAGFLFVAALTATVDLYILALKNFANAF